MIHGERFLSINFSQLVRLDYSICNGMSCSGGLAAFFVARNLSKFFAKEAVACRAPMRFILLGCVCETLKLKANSPP